MRILLLSPNYVGIHIPIIEELKKQGHQVVWIEDVDIPYNFRIPRTPLNRLRCKFNTFIKNPHRKYWEKVWKEKKAVMEEPFNLFFCINGRSLCPELFSKLNSMPNIRKVLYVWDSVSIFDFFYYNNEFDKIYTFDQVDAQKYQNVNYLPFFWFDKKEYRSTDKRYDISIIGTDHDDRYNIVEKILPQVKGAGLSYYFKILIFKPDYSHIAFYRTRLKYSSSLKTIIKKSEEVYFKKVSSEIATIQPISPEDYNHIMDETSCVLDTDRGTQSGITPRAIWALSKGKKMITTNRNFINTPFYNPEQILIIDRNNPDLDIDFIRSEKKFDMHPFFEKLRIDNWLSNFLNVD